MAFHIASLHTQWQERESRSCFTLNGSSRKQVEEDNVLMLDVIYENSITRSVAVGKRRRIGMCVQTAKRGRAGQHFHIIAGFGPVSLCYHIDSSRSVRFPLIPNPKLARQWNCGTKIRCGNNTMQYPDRR